MLSAARFVSRIGPLLLFAAPALVASAAHQGAASSKSSTALDLDALTVFHDELDIAPFKVKVKQGGGTAGHNGLRSIDKHLGADFRRVRLGIGHPGHKDRVSGYVLGNYAKVEQDLLVTMLGAISAEAEWLAKGDDPRFMSDVALRMQ